MTHPLDTQEAPASNVVEALRRVMRDLPAIAKKKDPNGGVAYAFRGIEAITQEAQGLCAQHGIVFVPRVVGTPEIVAITVNGKPWTDTRMLVEYDVLFAGDGPGVDTEQVTVGPIFAIGRDNSDKGANKCMTQAFKYALLQLFMISDAKDDGDKHADVADAWANTGADDEFSKEELGNPYRQASLKGEITSADITRMRPPELMARVTAAGLNPTGKAMTKKVLMDKLTEHLLATGSTGPVTDTQPASGTAPEAIDGALLGSPDDAPHCLGCGRVVDVSGGAVAVGDEGVENEIDHELWHAGCIGNPTMKELGS